MTDETNGAEPEGVMTDKQINEALDPPVDRLKHMRRLLAEHNYYGRPIDDDFAALDAAIAALERQRVPEGDKDE